VGAIDKVPLEILLALVNSTAEDGNTVGPPVIMEEELVIA
jgi:hypothetical protein